MCRIHLSSESPAFIGKTQNCKIFSPWKIGDIETCGKPPMLLSSSDSPGEDFRKDRTGKRTPVGTDWVLCKEWIPAGDVSPQVSGLDASPVYFTSSFSGQQQSPRGRGQLGFPPLCSSDLTLGACHTTEVGTGWWYVCLSRLHCHRLAWHTVDSRAREDRGVSMQVDPIQGGPCDRKDILDLVENVT